MSNYDFNNKTVILTGASSGIGKCIAEILINEYNSTVYAVARNEQKLIDVKNSFNQKSNLYIVTPFDVGVHENWQNFYTNLVSSGANPSVLINCAGVLPKFSSVNFTDVKTIEDVMNINFFSIVYSSKTVLPLIRKNKGIMINVISSSALCPFSGVASYSASKAGAERFSECLQVEETNLSVLTAMPGFTKTEVLRSQTATDKEKGLIGRISANPMRVARKILNSAKKRKKRIIIGIDAHFMNFLFKFFPRSAPRIITWFLKKTKMKIFEDI